jgi:hypothetical protein
VSQQWKLAFAASREADWKSRREACISMIDTGYIKPGVKLREIAPVFGNYQIIPDGSVSAKCTMFVSFEFQAIALREHEQFGINGWYLMIRSDKDGDIIDYHLSNCWK